MKNFVNLEEQENYEIKNTKLTPKIITIEEPEVTVLKPILSETLNKYDVVVFDQKIDELKINKTPLITEEIDDILPKMNLSETLSEETVCVACVDASGFYGDREIDGCFKRENLFSELVNEYERAIARQNLGIGDSQTLNWGNIKGNIQNQEDLTRYIFDSPQFNGVPTAPTQLIIDSSNAIATTQWVVNYVKQHSGGGSSNPTNLVLFTVTPDYATRDNEEVQVRINWEYNTEVSSQALNGEELDVTIREKTLLLTDSTLIELNYVVDDKSYSKQYQFIFHYPFYFGTSDNYLLLTKTISKSFSMTVNQGEYIYLILPINDAILSVNGFVGGFEIVNEFVLHNTMYYIYKSVNSGLGKLTVNLNN